MRKEKTNLLLATFKVDETKDVFNIYGEYAVAEDFVTDIVGDKDDVLYKYPKFVDVKATKIEEGIEQEYISEGVYWNGTRVTVYDMIGSFLSSLIKGDSSYTKVYLEEGLQKIVNSYTADSEIAVTVNEKKIPKRVLTIDMDELFQLMLVTNEFIYYGCDEAIHMLSTKDHSLVSDNYFAEIGYFDSVEDIRKGSESLIWGVLPEE